MPDDNTYDDDQADDDVQQDSPRDFRRMLAEQGAQVKQLENDNRLLAREVAFSKANLPDTPQIKFFREHYNGDATPEAIRQAATDAGFNDTGPSASEQAQLNMIQQTVSGASAPITQGSDDAMYEEMRQIPLGAQDAGQQIESIMRKYGRPVASDTR